MYKSGINIIKSKNKIANIRIFYTFGSKYETKENIGISHLIEHLMCKGVDHMQNDFQSNGIFLNAYTSHDMICYHISGLEEKVIIFAEDFIEGITQYELNEEDFKKEKNIVIEEIIDYQSDNGYVLSVNMMTKYFNYYGPAGNIETVNNFTYEDALSFLEDIKNNLHSIVFHVNDTNIDIDSNNLKFNDNFDINHEWKLDEYDNKLLQYNKGEDELTYYTMSSFPVNKKYNNQLLVLQDMIGNEMLSVLCQEIREKRGLTYSVNCSIEETDKNAYLNIYFKTKAKLEEFENVINDCLINNYEEYITEELFNSTKNMIIIERDIKKEKNTFDSIYYHPTYNLETIENVTFESVIELFKLGLFENGIVYSERI